MNSRDPRFHALVDLTRVAERLATERDFPESHRIEAALKALLEDEPAAPQEARCAPVPRMEDRSGDSWFERDAGRFSAERKAIVKWLQPADGAALFGIDGGGQLHADGRVRFGRNLGPRLSIRFPPRYPSAHPEFFIFGEDGPTPVRVELAAAWHEERDCGALIEKVVETLKDWLGRQTGRVS